MGRPAGSKGKGKGAKPNKDTKPIKHDKANKDSSADKFSSVQVALQEAELPESVRELLRRTLPGAFNVNGPRHQFQERMCKMIGEALGTVHAKRQRELVKCKRQLCQDNAEFQEGENSRDQAQTALEKSIEVVDSEQEAVNANGCIVAGAKRIVEKAEAVLRQCQEDITKYTMVRYASEELRACLESVPNKSDAQELVALSLETPVEDLDVMITSSAKASVEALQSLCHARAALVAAEAKHQACKDTLKNAREVRGQREKELKAVQKTLRQKEKQIQETKDAVEEARTQSKAFQNEPLEEYANVCKAFDMPLPMALQDTAEPTVEDPAPPKQEKKTLQIQEPQEQQIRRRRTSWLPRHLLAAKKQKIMALKQDEPAAKNQNSTEEQPVDSSPSQPHEAGSQEEVSVVMPVAEEPRVKLTAEEASTETPAAAEAANKTEMPATEEVSTEMLAAKETSVEPMAEEVAETPAVEEAALKPTSEEAEIAADEEMPAAEGAAEEIAEMLATEKAETSAESADVFVIEAEEGTIEPYTEDNPEEVAMEAEEVEMEAEVSVDDTEAAGAPMINPNRKSAVMRRRSAWLPDGMFTMFSGRGSASQSTEAADAANDPKGTPSKADNDTDLAHLPTPHRTSLGAASDASHESIE